MAAPTRPAFPRRAHALADPERCPWCGEPHGGGGACAACRFPLGAPEAGEAWSLSEEIVRGLDERAALLLPIAERGRELDRLSAELGVVPERAPVALTFPSRPEDLASSRSCPWCAGPLGGQPRCPGCGFPVRAPEAQRPWALSQRIVGLIGRREELLRSAWGEAQPAAVGAAAPAAPPVAGHPAPAAPSPLPGRVATGAARPAPVPVTAPVPPLAPAPAPAAGHSPASRPRRSSVQLLLLWLGVGLLSVAAIVFTTIAWIVLDTLGRALITAGVTLAAILGSSLLRRVRLGATGEGIAAFGAVLLLLDVWGAEATGLIDVAPEQGALYWGAGLAVVAVLGLLWGRLSGLRAPAILGALVVVPAAALLVGGAAHLLDRDSSVLWGMAGAAGGGLLHPAIGWLAGDARRVEAPVPAAPAPAAPVAAAPAPAAPRLEQGVLAGLGVAALPLGVAIATIMLLIQAAVGTPADPAVAAVRLAACVALALAGGAHWILARRTLGDAPGATALRCTALGAMALAATPIAVAVAVLAPTRPAPGAGAGDDLLANVLEALSMAIPFLALAGAEVARRRVERIDPPALRTASIAAAMTPALLLLGGGVALAWTSLVLATATTDVELGRDLAGIADSAPWAIGLALGVAAMGLAAIAGGRSPRIDAIALGSAGVPTALLAATAGGAHWALAFSLALLALGAVVAGSRLLGARPAGAAPAALAPAVAPPGAGRRRAPLSPRLSLSLLAASAPLALLVAALGMATPWTAIFATIAIVAACLVLALGRPAPWPQLAAAAAPLIAALGARAVPDAIEVPAELSGLLPPPAAAAAAGAALALALALLLPALRRSGAALLAAVTSALAAGGIASAAHLARELAEPSTTGSGWGLACVGLLLAAVGAVAIVAHRRIAGVVAAAALPILGHLALALALDLALPVDGPADRPLAILALAAGGAAVAAAAAGLAVRLARDEAASADARAVPVGPPPAPAVPARSIAVDRKIALAAAIGLLLLVTLLALPLDAALRAPIFAAGALAALGVAADRAGIAGRWSVAVPADEHPRKAVGALAPILAALAVHAALRAWAPELDPRWAWAIIALVPAATAAALILGGQARADGRAPLAASSAVAALLTAVAIPLADAVVGERAVDAIAAPALLIALLVAIAWAGVLRRRALRHTAAALLIAAAPLLAPFALAIRPAPADEPPLRLLLPGLVAVAYLAAAWPLRRGDRLERGIARALAIGAVAVLALGVAISGFSVERAPIATALAQAVALAGLAAIAILGCSRRTPAASGRLITPALATAAAWSGAGAALLATLAALGGLGDPRALVDPIGFPKLELLLAPAAAGLLGAGARRLAEDRAVRSWPALGPGLAVLLIPLLLAELRSTEGARIAILGVLALAAVLVGAIVRLQAPLVLGAIALTIHAALSFWPAVAAVYEAVPWWVWLAIAGAILIAVAATYEARLRDARRAARSIAGMR